MSSRFDVSSFRALKQCQRCDAVKPQCGPCAASRAYQDCEFTDSGPTRTQLLQEQIAQLESRIKAIERPLDSK